MRFRKKCTGYESGSGRICSVRVNIHKTEAGSCWLLQLLGSELFLVAFKECVLYSTHSCKQVLKDETS